MKKLFSLILAMLLLALPVMGLAEAAPTRTTFDWLWEHYDLSYLTKAGLFTEDEVRLLSVEKEAIDAGRELVSTVQFAAEGLTGDPAADAALAELLEALSLTAGVGQDEANLVVSLSGQDVLSVGYGEKDGASYLASDLLEKPVTLKVEEVDGLLMRLVNAAQAAGLIDSKQATQLGFRLGMTPFSVMVRNMPVSMLLLEGIDPATLDLTAWNEALAPVQARMVVTPVTEQPGDCDAAAETWTVDVTEADMNAFVIAGLQVVRDNPELCSAISDYTGYDRYASMSGAASFEQKLDELITSVPEEELFSGSGLRLTGWTDAAGEMVRLTIDILDTDVDEEAVKAEAVCEGDGLLAGYFADGAELNKLVLTITHTRSTTDGVTVWTTLIGEADDGTCFSLTEGDGVWSAGMKSTGGGKTYMEMTLAVVYDLTREAGVTKLSGTAELSMYEYYGEYKEGGFVPRSYQPLTASLDAQIAPDGCHIDAAVQLADMNEAGEALTIAVTSDCAVDGIDFTGTDTVVTTLGDRKVTATAQTRTQEPQGSIFAGDAVHLADLTDEELAAWLTGLIGRGEEAVSEAMTLLPQSIRDALTEEPDADDQGSAKAEPQSQQIVVDANPSTGYDWEVLIEQEGEVLRIERSYESDFTPSYEGELVPPGTGGQYTYTLYGVPSDEAEAPRTVTITLNYRRAWEDAEPAETLVYNVQVDAAGNVTFQE